tara:strand:- start:3158 stop:3811 length:654 start_codon:yes stop_codon:yes gene_type:complete
MGYLDNRSITVDAILTKRGRELLSKNDGSFKITQFALSDDEIDYSLFNESHPNGTQYSAEAIENMPLIEAIPNGTISMNSKLITLTRGANAIPYIGALNNITLTQGASNTISPTTYNLGGNNNVGEEEYIFTVLDNRLVDNFEGLEYSAYATAADVNEFSTIARSQSVRGKKLQVQGTVSNALFNTSTTTKTTSVVVEGVTSGAILSFSLTIQSSNS